MSSGILVARLDEIGVVALLSSEARKLANASTERSVRSLLLQLVNEGLERDALLVLPYTVSPRMAIWWSCVCVWDACGSAPSPMEDDALAIAVRWVREPSAILAEKAAAIAKADHLQSSVGCCCRAIAMHDLASGNRSALRGIAKVLGYSAQLALRQARGRGIPRSARQYVQFGLAVDAGKVPWN